MKYLVIGLVLLLNMPLSKSQVMQLMTYNIRYDAEGDGENRWMFRKQFLANQIMFHAPNVFGIQEGLHHQVNYLDSMLHSYSYIGVGRDDGKTEGEYSAIFYKTECVNVIEQSTFWLSETPEKISVGWDAALERICTYALFEDMTSGKRFWVFNTHFDHRGELARKESAKLIIKKIRDLNKKKYPVVLMGDFNLEPTHTSITYITKFLNDSHQVCEVCFGPQGTFNGFNFCEPVTRRIDYIFVSADAKVIRYAVLSDSWKMKYPSDHLPVFVELQL